VKVLVKTRIAWGAFALCLVVAVVASVFTLGVGGSSQRDRPAWRTARVGRTNLRAAVTATGTLQPVVIAPVGAQVSGIVWKLHADFNAHVQAGQVLVELEPALFRNAVEQAQANLATAQAKAAQVKAQLSDTVRTRDRSRTLAGGKFLPQADADSAETAVEAAQAALEASAAAVQQARAQLERTRLDLAHSVIHSPVTGTVIARNVDVGQAVASSFTAPTLFTIADDLTKMYLHAAVDEADIGQMHVDQRATFTVDTFRGHRFDAKVHQIRNSAQTQSNVVTYDVVMLVENPDLQLRPGMTANVSIICAAREGVLAVPSGALRFRPPAGFSSEPVPAAVAPARANAAETDHAPKGPPAITAANVIKAPSAGTLWVVDGGDLRRIAVQTGINDGTSTEVTGVDEGQEVVIDLMRARDKDAPAPNPGSGNGSGRGF
jgi:HlyD family secretion protein